MGDQQWQLKAAVVHNWRAHRERMRALTVSGDESTVVTAGRGLVNGRDSEVVRCWRLSDGAPGAPSAQGSVCGTVVALSGPSTKPPISILRAVFTSLDLSKG